MFFKTCLQVLKTYFKWCTVLFYTTDQYDIDRFKYVVLNFATQQMISCFK